jgi:Fic family protein
MAYNWQLKDWKNFTYAFSEVEDLLFEFAEKSGRIKGLLEGLSVSEQEETLIDLLVSEAIKTSEIENEYLSRTDVLSSIRHNLGLEAPHEIVKDARAKGIGQMMVYVRQNYKIQLTVNTVKDWHKMLFLNVKHINVGEWRTHEAPMQVISGRVDNPVVHFEAPPSSIVPQEMNDFIKWFNYSSPIGKTPLKHAPIRSAIAHIYFESIHPFEDGNGRIGRAISYKALSQSLGYPLVLSISKSIEKSKSDYYSALKEGQKSNEITSWILYFLKTMIMAQKQAEELIQFTLKKTKFFDHFSDNINQRQLKSLQKMFSKGNDGFEGGMTSRKHMSINKISKATATRDLMNLEKIGAFKVEGQARNTKYYLNLDFS